MSRAVYPPATAVGKGAWIKARQIYSRFLVPEANIYINARSIDINKPTSTSVFEIPGRVSKVVQLGRHHGFEGTISGQLLDAEGRTADEWRRRLEDLIETQQEWSYISLISRDVLLENIVILDDVQIAPVLHPTPLYDIGFSFIELK